MRVITPASREKVIAALAAADIALDSAWKKCDDAVVGRGINVAREHIRQARAEIDPA